MGYQRLLEAEQNIITTAVDLTITDGMPNGSKFLVNCNTASQYGLITINLPTLADNVGKWFEVEMGADQGMILVDGEGGEFLNYKGDQILTCLIYNPGMQYKFFNNGTDWVMSGCNRLRKSYGNRSEYRASHFGNGVTYDNGGAASTKSVDWTGMVVTEATSGFTGVVVEDTGGAGLAGILYIYDLSSGFTFWTNNRVLTASNGETIDINEGTGSSKNIDYDFFHEFGINRRDITSITCSVSTDGTDNNSFEISLGNINSNGANEFGTTISQVDTNSNQIQSSGEGWVYVNAAGVQIAIDTEDWYEDIIFDFSC